MENLKSRFQSLVFRNPANLEKKDIFSGIKAEGLVDTVVFLGGLSEMLLKIHNIRNYNGLPAVTRLQADFCMGIDHSMYRIGKAQRKKFLDEPVDLRMGREKAFTPLPGKIMIMGYGRQPCFHQDIADGHTHFEVGRKGGSVFGNQKFNPVRFHPFHYLLIYQLGIQVDMIKKFPWIGIGIEEGFFLAPVTFRGMEGHLGNQRFCQGCRMGALITAGENEYLMALPFQRLPPILPIRGQPRRCRLFFQ